MCLHSGEFIEGVATFYSQIRQPVGRQCDSPLRQRAVRHITGYQDSGRAGKNLNINRGRRPLRRSPLPTRCPGNSR